jgi:hypothetical protein
VRWTGQPASADLILSGPAADLLLALTRRRPVENTGISLQGDTAPVALMAGPDAPVTGCPPHGLSDEDFITGQELGDLAGGYYGEQGRRIAAPAQDVEEERMPIMDRLDPELRVVVEQVPVMDLTDLAAARAALAELYSQINTSGSNPQVSHADHMAPGGDGNPDVMVRVFRPAEATETLPCLYWTQGGGYVLTAPDMDDEFCEQSSPVA